MIPISALNKKNISSLLVKLKENLHSLVTEADEKDRLSASKLTECVLSLVESNPPPRTNKGVRPKIKFVHIGGRRPFSLILHGRNLKYIPPSYVQYLSKSIASEFTIKGFLPKLVLKDGE